MTAESNIVPSLELRPDVVDSFAVKRTSVPPPEVLKQWDGVLGSGYDSEGRATTSEPGSPGSILASFDQRTFNALPRNLRITLTRYFLRDLTTLSLYADSFLVTGASVSRVMNHVSDFAPSSQRRATSGASRASSQARTQSSVRGPLLPGMDSVDECAVWMHRGTPWRTPRRSSRSERL